MAVSAGSVLLVAAGGILAYAGFTNQNPLEALRGVSSGKPSSIRNEPGIDSASFASTGGSASGLSGDSGMAFAGVTSGGGLPGLPRACERYSGDRYSQVRRNQPGYSDCSSFVGKGMKLLGVKPPAGSTTGGFLTSRDWKRVPAEDVQAGDLAISTNHVIVCYGNGYAIGQQNPRRNVQRGRVDDLMYGNKPYFFIRYTPRSASTPNSVMA